MRLYLAIVLGAFATQPCFAGMTVEEAYSAIPHARTVFQKQQAKMPKPEVDYLMRSFELVDQAIVCKVETMKAFSKKPLETWKCHDEVLALMAKNKPPEKLIDYQNLVIKAVEDQKSWFNRWKREGKQPAFDGEVSAASGKLHQAFDALKRLYPQEGPQNQQSFFDYLCALDFI